MKRHSEYKRSLFREKHPDILKLLEIRPSLLEMLRLPWWYNRHVAIANSIRKKAKKENPAGPFCLAYTQLLAACYCDRTYIDVALEHVHFNTRCSNPKQWMQAYLDVGLTLCNLRYQCEGISYVEKAISLETRPDYRIRMKTWLCFRLNAQMNPEETLKLVEDLASEKPEDTVVKAVLAKAYLDTGRLDEAADVIKTLVEETPTRFGFLMAGLHFARKDFQAAMRAFEQYGIHRRALHFWLPEYDYKKALTYHYCNQRDKCRVQALRIRRRLKWDKFYRLDAVEKGTIERVPAVDEMINSNEPDNAFFDWDRISHYWAALRCIAMLYVAEYWHILVLLFVVLVVIFRNVARYL
jgi:tetratricopeptide (TPR) repeat protein